MLNLNLFHVSVYCLYSYFWQFFVTIVKRNRLSYTSFSWIQNANVSWNQYYRLHQFNREEQPSRCLLRKRCSEIMQQIHMRTPTAKCDSIKLLCDFFKIALWHRCSPVNLLHIFRTSSYRNTSAGLLPNRLTIPTVHKN